MHPIINILKILGLNTNHKGFMCIARVLHYLLIKPSKIMRPYEDGTVSLY